MIPNELLDQAAFLARPEGRDACDADFRRGVSACYYAVFHALVGDATEQVAHHGTIALKTIVRRTISHAQITHICQLLSRPIEKIPDPLRSTLSDPLEPGLIFLSKAFPELQQARHQADYDDQAVFDVVTVMYWHGAARFAYDGWLTVRNTPNAAVFLTAILLGEKLGKRG